MFRNQVKVKTFSILKSSDKKRLIAKITSIFPVSEDEILTMFSQKDQISCHRILTAAEKVVIIYGCNNKPLFYETKDAIYPTIYALWLCPAILPAIPMQFQLINKLIGGADLMIPGVRLNTGYLDENEITEGSLVYVCTLENISAVAVGTTMVSTKCMRPGEKGKAVHIHHVIGDELCRLFNVIDWLPDLGPMTSAYSNAALIEKEFRNMPIPSSCDTNVSSEEASVASYNSSKSTADSGVSCSTVSDTADSDSLENVKEQMTMDTLLNYCFLKALKTSASKTKLPLLTNIFYKNHILEAVPKDLSIDLRKTKYKKLSYFLLDMEKKGIISVHSEKGVQSITSINFEHDLLKEFKVEQKDDATNIVAKFEVEEKYLINNAVFDIFSKYNYKKGDQLTEKQVRSYVTTFFKSGNLVDPTNEQYVTLNDRLCSALGTKEYRMSWKQLFDIVFKKMSNMYTIKTPYCSGIVSGKGKLPHIKLSTVSKASNKQVTLVDNLECYGINLNEFSKQCQRGVAASSTINALPNKQLQFQIQGNQKKFITNLLTGDYQIPKRYIDGWEEKKRK